MKRWLLGVSGLGLAAVSGFALVVWLALPDLVEKAARVMLRERGVTEVSVPRAQFDEAGISAMGLSVVGAVDGVHFTLSVTRLHAELSWQALRLGRLHALELEAPRLELSFDESVDRPHSAATSLPAPSHLLDELPLSRLMLHQGEVILSAAGVDPLRLSLEGSIDKAISEKIDNGFTVKADIGFQRALLSARLEAQARSRVHWELTLHPEHSAVPAAELIADLSIPTTGPWQWDFEGRLDIAGVQSVVQRLRSLMPELPETPEHIAGLLQWSGTLAHPHEIPANPRLYGESAFDWTLDLSLRSRLEVLQLQDGLKLEATEVALELVADGGAAQLQLAPGGWALEMAPDSELLDGVSPPVRDVADPVDISVAWVKPLTLNSLDLRQWVVDGSGLSFSLLTGAHRLRYEADQLRVSVSEVGVLDHAVVAGLLSGDIADVALPAMRLVAGWQQSDQPLFVGYQWVLTDVAESLTWRGEGALSPSTGEGELSYELRSLDLPYAVEWTTRLVGDMSGGELPLVVTGGSVDLTGDLHHENYSLTSVRHSASLLLADIDGVWAEYPFEGLGLSTQIAGLEQMHTSGPVDLYLARLNLGFDVTALQSRFSLPPSSTGRVIAAESFSAEMFGGHTRLPHPHRWELERSSNELLLSAQRWRLAEMVALQKGQNIEARGELSGELPIAWDEGRLLVDAGYLRSREPGGRIRYQPDASTQALARGNKELGLALDLLEDFEFDLLRSDVQLDKEGILLLGLSLSGNSPEIFGGRKVEFNINVEQNVDPLLRSLRLNDRLLEDISGKLQ